MVPSIKPALSLRCHAQGAGKQTSGAIVNFVSFYIFGIPLALLLAFKFGYDVTGMYAGACAVGPVDSVEP